MSAAVGGRCPATERSEPLTPAKAEEIVASILEMYDLVNSQLNAARGRVEGP